MKPGAYYKTLVLTLSLGIFSSAQAELKTVNSRFETIASPDYEINSERDLSTRSSAVYIDGLIRSFLRGDMESDPSYRFTLKSLNLEGGFLLRYGIYLAVKDNQDLTEPNLNYYVLGTLRNETTHLLESDFTLAVQGELIEFAIFADVNFGPERGVERLWYKNLRQENQNFKTSDTFLNAESNYISGNEEEYPLQASAVYWGKP